MYRLILFVLCLSANTIAAPQRIISLAPHTTELIYALDSGDKLVAASDYSDYPLAAKSLPRVANHNGVNFEAIVRLKPDLILAWKGGNKPQDLARLASLGYKLFYSHPQLPKDIGTELVALGKLLDQQALAEKLSKALNQSLLNITHRAKQHPSRKVFYYMWPKPMMTVGEDAWANKLLKLCNAENIFADALTPYPEVGVEQVVRRQPQVIVAAMNTTLQQVEDFWRLWQPMLKAKLITANPDKLHRFTPRLVTALDTLCQSIHSD